MAQTATYANRKHRVDRHLRLSMREPEGRFALPGMPPMPWMIVTDFDLGIPFDHDIDPHGGIPLKPNAQSPGENFRTAADRR